MKHLSESDLQDYADQPDGLEAREEIERHLSECSTCSQAVRDYQVLARSFRDPRTWRAGNDERHDDDASDLSRFDELLAREDKEADVLLAPYLGSRYRPGYGDIVTKKRYRTAGVVRRLCLAADARDLFVLCDDLRASDSLLATEVEALARSVYEPSDTPLTEIAQ